MWILGLLHKTALAVHSVTLLMELLVNAARNDTHLTLSDFSHYTTSFTAVQVAPTPLLFQTSEIAGSILPSSKNAVLSNGIVSASSLLQNTLHIPTMVNSIYPTNSLLFSDTYHSVSSMSPQHSVSAVQISTISSKSEIMKIPTKSSSMEKVLHSSLISSRPIWPVMSSASIRNILHTNLATHGNLYKTVLPSSHVLLLESMKKSDNLTSINTLALWRSSSHSQVNLLRSSIEPISSHPLASNFVASSSVFNGSTLCVSNCAKTPKDNKEFMLMMVGVGAGAIFLFVVIFVASAIFVRKRSVHRGEGGRISYKKAWSPAEKSSDELLGASESMDLFTSSTLQLRRGINNPGLEDEDSVTTLPSSSGFSREKRSTFNPNKSGTSRESRSESVYLDMEDVDTLPTGFQQTTLTGVGKEKTEDVSLKLQTNWTDALADPNSEEYSDLKEDIESSMQLIYGNEAGFRGAHVKRFRKGSVIANIELRFLLDQPNPLGPLQQAVSNGKIGHMKVDKHFPLVQEEREEPSDLTDGDKPIAWRPSSVKKIAAAKQNGQANKEKKNSSVKVEIPISEETSTDNITPNASSTSVEHTQPRSENYPELHVNIDVETGEYQRDPRSDRDNLVTDESYQTFLENERCESEPSSSPPAYSNLTSLTSISEMNIAYNPMVTENDMQTKGSISGSRDSGIGSMHEITKAGNDRNEKFYDIPEADEAVKSQQSDLVLGSGVPHIAVFNFTAQDWRELPMQQGEVVNVIKRDAAGWVKAVNRNGKRGWVPASFLIHVDPTHLAPTKETVATLEFFDSVLDQFETESSSGSSDVTTPNENFSPINEYITPINANIQPINEYLTPVNENLTQDNDSLTLIDDQDKSSGNGYSYAKPEIFQKEPVSQKVDATTETGNYFEALFSFDGQGPDELSFREKDVIELLKPSDTGWWKGRTRGREGWFPASYVKALEKIKVKDSYNTVPPRHGKDGKKKRKGSSSEKPGSVEDLFAPPESLKTLYVQILRTKSLSESARPASIKKRKQETQPREYAEIPEKIEDLTSEKRRPDPSKLKLMIPPRDYQEPDLPSVDQASHNNMHISSRDYEQPDEDPSCPERLVPSPPKDLSASSPAKSPIRRPPKPTMPPPRLSKLKQEKQKPASSHGQPPKRPVPPPPSKKPALISAKQTVDLSKGKDKALQPKKATDDSSGQADKSEEAKHHVSAPVGIKPGLDDNAFDETSEAKERRSLAPEKPRRTFSGAFDLKIDSTASDKQEEHVEGLRPPKKPLPELSDVADRKKVLSETVPQNEITAEQHPSPPKKPLPPLANDKPLSVITKGADGGMDKDAVKQSPAMQSPETEEQHTPPPKNPLPSLDAKSSSTTSAPPNRPILPVKPLSIKRSNPPSSEESKPSRPKSQPHIASKSPPVAQKPAIAPKRHSASIVSSSSTIITKESKSPPPERPPAPKLKATKSSSLEVSDSDETRSPPPQRPPAPKLKATESSSLEVSDSETQSLKPQSSKPNKPVKPTKALSKMKSIKHESSLEASSDEETRSFSRSFSLKALVESKKQTKANQSEGTDFAIESILSGSESDTDSHAYMNVSKSGGPLPPKRPASAVALKKEKGNSSSKNITQSGPGSLDQGTKKPPPKPISPPVLDATREGKSAFLNSLPVSLNVSRKNEQKPPKPVPRPKSVELELEKDNKVSEKHPLPASKPYTGPSPSDTDKKPVPAPRKKSLTENLDEKGLESNIVGSKAADVRFELSISCQVSKEKPDRPPLPSVSRSSVGEPEKFGKKDKTKLRRVIKPYTSKSDQELSLIEGTVLFELRPVSSQGMCYGLLEDGNQGWYPADHVTNVFTPS